LIDCTAQQHARVVNYRWEFRPSVVAKLNPWLG